MHFLNTLPVIAFILKSSSMQKAAHDLDQAWERLVSIKPHPTQGINVKCYWQVKSIHVCPRSMHISNHIFCQFRVKSVIMFHLQYNYTSHQYNNECDRNWVIHANRIHENLPLKCNCNLANHNMLVNLYGFHLYCGHDRFKIRILFIS